MQFLFMFCAIGGVFVLLLGLKFSQHPGRYALIGIAMIVFACFLLTFSPSSSGNKYSDVFKKNPNEWTADEEEYVNDFFEWQSEYYG